MGDVAFLRLLRLMRLLKLLSKFETIRILISGLLKGLASVTYILVLLCLIIYVFAIIGVNWFRDNDPFHFGKIEVACITLFRVATLDNWTTIMMINYFGCDSQYTSVDGVSHVNFSQVRFLKIISRFKIFKLLGLCWRWRWCSILPRRSSEWESHFFSHRIRSLPS